MTPMLLFSLLLGPPAGETAGYGRHGYLDSDGVKLHYVENGQGPLLVLLHGFPDFWYSWRHQIPALARDFHVVALDLRGYNRSGQPKGVESYAMEKLVADVAATVKHFGEERAIVCGHDWGGAIAWSFAMAHPEVTDRLVVLNLPHPAGLLRELANNPEQQKSSRYARELQKPGAASQVTPERLTFWIRDAGERKRYLEAFRRSSIPGMLSYYRANYPRPPYDAAREFPPVRCPVLLVHGLDDPALLPGALNDTWKWVERDLTLVTVPKAGHWVHHDAKELVTRAMVSWLRRSGVAASADRAHRRIQAVIEEVDRICRERTVFMVGPEKARRLAELVRERQPEYVVECGTALGYSGLWIARELQRAGRGRLVTIELDPARARQAREHFRRAGVGGIVEVRVGDAREVVKELPAGVDFLFLDCNYQNYGPSLQGIEDKLKDGALLVADNVGIGASGMADYLKAARTHESRTEWFDIDLPWGKRDAMEITVYRPGSRNREDREEE